MHRFLSQVLISNSPNLPPNPIYTHNSYEAATLKQQDLQRPYTSLANLLNCSADEIAIVSSATEAWQKIVYGLVWSHHSSPSPSPATDTAQDRGPPSPTPKGYRILTVPTEYGSCYISYLQLQKQTAIRDKQQQQQHISVHILPETAEGDIDLDTLERTIQDTSLPPPLLISLAHAPTSSGRCYDVCGIGKIAKKYNITYVVDACQTVGQMPVDVQAIGCDFLSGTGRKYLRAPRGSGFLYARSASLHLLEPGVLDNVGAVWAGREEYELSPGAKRFESYEMSFASKLGLGVAVEMCVKLGVERIWERVQGLAALMRRRLEEEVGEVRIQDHGKTLCGLVSFSVNNSNNSNGGSGLTETEVQRELLKQYKINTSVSKLSSTRIDFEDRDLQEVVRASVHYYNTEEEIDTFINALKSILHWN